MASKRAGGAFVDDGAELVVGEEGAVRVQRGLPFQDFKAFDGVVLDVLRVRRRPAAGDQGFFRLAVHREVGFKFRRVLGVEVAPALAPFGGFVLPA